MSIDSTKDGKLLLATTKKYLVLLKTYDHGKYAYTNKELGGVIDKIKLYIKSEDIIALKIQDWSFTPAKFNCGGADNEKYIISSIGKKVFIWNLDDVLKGEKEKYTIIEMENNIISNEFLFGSDKKFISLQAKSLVLQDL